MFKANEETNPFSTTIRCLLVENILNNVDFRSDNLQKKREKKFKNFITHKKTESIKLEAAKLEDTGNY